jgi:hypothetical protein
MLALRKHDQMQKQHQHTRHVKLQTNLQKHQLQQDRTPKSNDSKQWMLKPQHRPVLPPVHKLRLTPKRKHKQ